MLGGHGLKERLVDLEVVAALLKGDAKHLLALDGFGHIGGVDLNHVVGAVSFFAQQLERLRRVTGGDDPVRHLALDELCRGQVAHVGEGHPVAKRAHAVGAACAGVGAGERRLVEPLDRVDEKGLFLALGERQADGARRGADVFEGGGRRHSERGFELAHKLPGVEGVQKVDETGTAGQHVDGQVAALLHEDAGRLLVGIAAVFE